MPKTEIDYSNTIIYKITCKDPTVKDVYVGHTTNFVQRKHAHKQCCINAKTLNYKCKLYETIRSNGGWNNWTMEIINFFKCRDHYEARIKEQEYFVLLNATLNSIEPLPKPKPITIPKEIVPKNIVIESNKPDKPKKVNKIFCKHCNIECIETEWAKHMLSDDHKTNRTKTLSGKYVCECCDYTCSIKSNYTAHLKTEKHKTLEKMPNQPTTFTCEYCQYTCSKKSNFNIHLKTLRHVRLENNQKQSIINTHCICSDNNKNEIY